MQTLSDVRRRNPEEHPRTPWKDSSGQCDPEACSICAYCGTALGKRHEHDHAPIPWKAGGDEWLPTCINCHDLKDRMAFDNWSAEVLTRMIDGATEPMTRIFMASMVAKMMLLWADVNELKAKLAQYESGD